MQLAMSSTDLRLQYEFLHMLRKQLEDLFINV